MSLPLAWMADMLRAAACTGTSGTKVIVTA
jgi:hypothetical protein